MKSIQFRAHGPSSALEIVEKPVVEISPYQVLVEVKAAALNHLDLWIRRGLPGLDIPLPHTPGSDASGVIVQAGSAIQDWKPGDEVVIQPGTFCGECAACKRGREDMCPQYGILGETEPGVQQQHLALSPKNIGPKPENLSFAEAAALPLASLTAWNMIKNRAQLKAGETLLVMGAGSGVGSMAVQMGAHLGARVIATAGNEEKQKLAYSLGAEIVFNHREEKLSKHIREFTGGKGVDVVIEHIGEVVWTELMKSLAVGARLVSCGATTGIQGQINLQHLFYKRLSILGSTMGSVSDFYECLHLARQKVLHPIIDKVMPFEEIQSAHNHLEFQHGFGKVVLEKW